MSESLFSFVFSASFASKSARPPSCNSSLSNTYGITRIYLTSAFRPAATKEKEGFVSRRTGNGTNGDFDAAEYNGKNPFAQELQKRVGGSPPLVASPHISLDRRAPRGYKNRGRREAASNRFPTGANKLALIKRETQGWKKGAPSCKGGASRAKVSLSFCYKSPLGKALSVCFFGGLFCSAFSQGSKKTFSQDSDLSRAKKVGEWRILKNSPCGGAARFH